MANDEYGDKTEQPTQRKTQGRREKGIVARSTDLTAAGLMLAACTAVMLLGIPTAKSLAQVMHDFLGGPAWLRIDASMAVDQFWGILKLLAGSLTALLLLMAAAALAFNLVQVGFLLSADAVKPDIVRISPFAGAKRLFSAHSLMRLGTSLAKLVLVAALAALSLHASLPSFLPLVGAAPSRTLFSIEQLLIKVGFTIAGALALLAVLDFLFQKWRHEQNLRMTKQEVREEMKSMEGDPAIRHRRREAHRKLSQAHDQQAVHNADVIITDPTNIAIAIQYDPETMQAPKVIAKGTGDAGRRIRLQAAEHGIPIIERTNLARTLDRGLKAGSFIPAEMYDVFIEIMAYVYRISNRAPSHETANTTV